MHKAENGHGIHVVLSFKSLSVNYHCYTKKVSELCSSTCRWRALIADLFHSDDSLWEEIYGKPWFQYSGGDYGKHYNQLAEKSFIKGLYIYKETEE